MNPTLQRIKQHQTPKPDRIPPGYFTIRQWSDSWGLSPSYVRHILLAEVRAKRWTRKKFRTPRLTNFFKENP